MRTLIVEAARDLLSDKGLDGLSMRAIAERIEYSPGTIYLYFRDKDALIREVVDEGVVLMGEYVRAELAALPETANAADQYGAMGRAYARFAIENTAYFRVMFELPGCAQMETPEVPEPPRGAVTFDAAVALVERARAEGVFGPRDAERTAIIGWGLIHGLVSLYLSGHLADRVTSHGEFVALVDEAMHSVGEGWRRRS